MNEIPQIYEDGIRYSIFGVENISVTVHAETDDITVIGKGYTEEAARINAEKLLMEDGSFVIGHRRLVSKWRKKHNLYEMMMK